MSSLNLFSLDNTFKEALWYLFIIVIQFHTVFYLKLNFKQKLAKKVYFQDTGRNSENLDKIYKKP